MRTNVLRSLLRRSLIATLLAPLPALAQMRAAAAAPTVFTLTPYAGVMVFGHMLDGPYGTSLTNKPGMLYGAQAGLKLSPEIALVGNLGYSESKLDVGVPILGGVNVGHSSALVYDADIEASLGTMKSGANAFTPIIQLGVGQMQYDVTAIDIIDTKATNLAVNVGLGVDMAIGSGMALRILAKDYMGKFNFQDAIGVGVDASTAHNIGLMAGLRFDF